MYSFLLDLCIANQKFCILRTKEPKSLLTNSHSVINTNYTVLHIPTSKYYPDSQNRLNTQVNNSNCPTEYRHAFQFL
jgi:hypothetical protein